MSGSVVASRRWVEQNGTQYMYWDKSFPNVNTRLAFFLIDWILDVLSETGTPWRRASGWWASTPMARNEPYSVNNLKRRRRRNTESRHSSATHFDRY